MTNFSSYAEEIRYYTEELLSDGKIYSVPDIKSYVSKHSDNAKNFTIGMYAGAIRSLVQNSGGKYVNAGRGRYSLKNAPQSAEEENGSETLKRKVINILEQSCDRLDEACTINIMNVSPSELEFASRVSGIIAYLRKAINEIG